MDTVTIGVCIVSVVYVAGVCVIGVIHIDSLFCGVDYIFAVAVVAVIAAFVSIVSIAGAKGGGWYGRGLCY